MAEQVKKASHYQNDNPLYEVWRVIRAWKLNFNRGSAVKYIARAGKKDDEIMELEKAREFLAFEIEALKAERAKAQESKHTDMVDAMFYAVDPITIATVKAESRSVKPVIVDIPDGVTPEEYINSIMSKLCGGK